VLPVVGDEHRAVRIETDRVADAPIGQFKSLLRLRGSGHQFPDRAAFAEIDDIEVAIGVDRGSFDAGGVFARRRDLAALKQSWFGPSHGRDGRDEKALTEERNAPAISNSHPHRYTRRSGRSQPPAGSTETGLIFGLTAGLSRAFPTPRHTRKCLLSFKPCAW